MKMVSSPIAKTRINKSRHDFTEPKGGFDLRVVRYEEIHSIKAIDFDELVKIIDVNQGETILDAGSGYGSVTREILKRFDSFNLDLILYDLHEIQLKRAIIELEGFFNKAIQKNQLKFVHGDLRKIDLNESSVDKVVAKMVIHEIPFKEQELVFKEFYRVLKPGGRLIIWETNLNDKTQDFFQETIRKKDELATFKHLCGTRYFLKEDELQKLSVNSNFKNFTKAHSFIYKINTKKRLIPEFNGDIEKLSKWNSFIRKKAMELPKDVLNEIDFQDKDKAIEFTVEKAIFTCNK